ncbi:MAG: GtrA family protein [Chloroflexi bacterium]|nr:MAG: GtrA family protein [Chloroflexota bacterium]
MLENILQLYHTRPKELTRFVKFAIVGAIGAVIDFGLLNLMKGYFGWPLLWANTLSVSVAIISNFTWNRLWTFPESRSRKKRVQLVQFALVNVVGLLINNVIVVGLDAVFVPYVGEPLSYNLAKAIAIGVVLFWNFGANRIWTYRGL